MSMKPRPAMLAATALLLAGCAGHEADRPDTGPAQGAPPDSAAAVRAAIDTLTRTGANDWVADSIARHGDTITVWTGPRVWMATDRPTTGVSIIAPARIVAIRHILGG
jgi:hypothetical protein